ncbi:lipoprotein [Mangrovibacterium lignilyticum]|uniref:lipoprotein n=1 Tax=Mangrovibacterium lignilyticum TaxID=2668052 RepID=UPI0013D540A6|nr:lipoprotein [Mangrovibacterium lignilyticum]
MKKSKLLLIGIVIFLAGCSNSASEFESEIDGNPSNECTPEFPGMDVTYNNYVAGVLNMYCIECHHTGNSQGPGDFSTYSGVLPYVDKFFVRVIPDNADMPQGNAPLPKAVRDSLNVWIRNCAPQN